MLNKIRNILKNNYKWIILLICVIIFYAILEDIFEYEKLKLDIIIYNIIVLKLRAESLTKIMGILTNFGGAYMLIGLAIMITIFSKNKKTAFIIDLNLIIITIFNLILKNIIQRPRPEGYRLIAESGYSFPSGHSMISMAFYGLIIYMIWKNMKNKKLRNIVCVLITILVILIGISRIYLGVHYASDVIGGFVVSIAYLIVYVSITKTILKIDREDNKKNEKELENENKSEKKERD